MDIAEDKKTEEYKREELNQFFNKTTTETEIVYTMGNSIIKIIERGEDEKEEQTENLLNDQMWEILIPTVIHIITRVNKLETNKNQQS